MYISKKKQAILDAFETEKEKQDYLAELRKELSEVASKWQKANPEKCREKNAKWQKANPVKIKEYGAKHYKENSEKCREKNAKYRKENSEKLKESRARYRAKKKAEKQLIETI
jgi:hypothetical protein